MEFLTKKKEKSNEETNSSFKEGKFKKLLAKKKTISAVLIIAILTASFFAYRAIWGDDKSAKAHTTAVASMGSVSQIIEGSGTISALSQYEITSLKKGEVIADYFEEGDVVNEDDILYLMDNSDGYDAIDNAKSSLNKAQRTYNDAKEKQSNLIVKSKVNGVVTNVYVDEGDSVGANTKICDVIDNTKMVLKIQFLSDFASEIREGVSQASVTLTKDGTVLYGTVTKVSSGTLTNSVGASVANVEIKVDNPGAIKEGDYATAEVEGFACSSEGTFSYNGKGSIYSEVSGEVEALNVIEGDNISYGETVAILSNDDISDISESYDNLSDAQKKHADALENLDDYVVKAPINGTIIQKNIKAGENLESTNMSVMAIIADLSSLVFEMSVDELDISKIKEGMEVEVTADAIEGVTFGATITNVSIVGTANNGVTSYPVKVTLNQKDDQKGFAKENYDKLIPGMNVSASVVIERVENVLVVPVSAVRRGNIVIVSESSKSEGVDPLSTMGAPTQSGGKQPEFSRNSAGNNSKSDTDKNGDEKANERLKNMLSSIEVPEGYKAIFVTTGLSSESVIEIKAGLTEGDKVLLPDTTVNTNPMQNMMGMMGGAPMGRMPMGGGSSTGRTSQQSTQNRAGGMR